jgi:hypothetical protein
MVTPLPSSGQWGNSTRKMDIGEKSAGYGKRSAMMFGKTVNLHPVHRDVTVRS